MEIRVVTHSLLFNKPAKTSRNTFTERLIRYIVIEGNGKQGIGEAAPLKYLSIDDVENYDQVLVDSLEHIQRGVSLDELDLRLFPSIRFGIETALLDWKNGGKMELFDTDFIRGKAIPINGLVWMSDLEAMYTEATEKIEAGFRCIKFKIGAHDFNAECRLLESIRKRYSAFNLEIRLDANGAFLPDDAQEKLKDLSRFEIHSIEQPIAPMQWDDMARLCVESKIDIALDEELIGAGEKDAMLRHIQPQYIILKPNLIGGMAESDDWIQRARNLNIGWWATSALESNIGLNAISQWVSKYDTSMPQGLGTGSLYSNNISSPLQVVNQSLVYRGNWDKQLFG